VANADVILHPGPAGESASDDFAVYIDGQPLFVYQARVSAVPLNQIWPGYQRPLDQTELASFACWDMGRPVSVEVVSRRPVDSVETRPLSLQISPVLNGNRICFTLERPVQVTVEVNGYHHALHLFASPPEEYRPDPDDPAVRYFGPGIHRPGLIELHSGETAYLAGGAVVHGAITAREAQGIRVLGRGILDLSGYERDGGVWGAFSCYRCADVVVDGIVMRDPPSWTLIPSASRNIRIANLKLIGLWRYNSDGIDLVNCQHVQIDRCFVRAFDDCIALKGLKGRKDAVTDDQDMEDILVTDCVIWNDWGRALEIGAETCADLMRDITFRNCDIIRVNHVALDIQHGDRALVTNVRFENIRVELDANPLPALIQREKGERYPLKDDYGFCPRLMVVEIKETGWNRDPVRGNVRGVQFEDIQVSTPKHVPASEFSGYDDTHTTEDVTVRRLTINGRPVRTTNEGRITVGPHARNVRILAE
jgi:hypothetical protein